MLPLEISNLIEQAKLNEKVVYDTDYTYELTILTPVGFVKPVGITGLAGMLNFVSNRTDDIRVVIQIPPGVYQHQIIPYCDDLDVEVIRTTPTETRVKYYRCTLLHVGDTELTGNSSKELDMSIYDDLNFIEIEIQLTDKGFSILRNIPFSTVCVGGKVEDVIHYYLGTETAKLELQGADRFKGVDLEFPVDNQVVYRQIKVPQGETMLINLPQYLQEGDYGVYSRGLGSYYREGRWWVYSLWNDNKYESSDYVMDIIRVPEDTIPELEQSYYLNDDILTIVSTGRAERHNNVDVNILNNGAGQQIISPKVGSGFSGVHVKDGKAIFTREDSLTQYQTNDRQNQEQKVLVNPIMTANLCRELSKSRIGNGEILVIPWVNGDPDLLKPGMAFRYYHLNSDQVLEVREGTLINVNYQFFPKSTTPGNITFTCNLNLTLFVGIDPVER